MGVEFISEATDNFRDHFSKDKSEEAQIIRYLQEDNLRKTKQKIYNNLKDKELMTKLTTEYREQSSKQDTIAKNDHNKAK